MFDTRFFGQHSRDVGVVYPQEGRVEVGVIQDGRQMGRHDEGAAGAVGREGVLRPLFPRETPLGTALAPQDWHPPPDGAQDLGGEPLAGAGLPLVVVTKVRHQTKDVDDHVVVGFKDPPRLQTVLGDPLQRRHALRQVEVWTKAFI